MTKKKTKAIIVGDLHIGVKKDDTWTYQYQLAALRNITQYAKANNISTIISTGDFFDVRNSISQITLNRIRTEIMPLFNDLHLITLVGNHDMKHREKIHPNSLDEILGYYSNVTVINKPTTMMINDKVPMDIIPWICNENKEEVFNFIKNSKTHFCVGHFELTGYYYYKGLKSSGIENKFLSSYNQVFSGHYHTISTGDNILYVGTPYTLTSGDSNDERGVWEVEISTDGDCMYHFIENDVINHVKLQFDADTFDANTVKDYYNKNVIVNVINRESSKQKMNVNILEQLLIEAGVHALKITDTINYDGIELVQGEDIIIKDNRDLVDEYIMQLDCAPSNKLEIQNLFNTMYIEAIQLKSEVNI